MANTITGFNVFTPLTVIESAKVNSNFDSLKNGHPLWQKYTVSYTNVSTAAASATYTLFTLSSSEIIQGLYVKHSTAFAGTSLTAAKVKVGITGDVTKYLDEFDVFQGVTGTAFSLNQLMNKEAADASILLTISLTGSNLNSLTAGVVDVYVQKNTLP